MLNITGVCISFRLGVCDVFDRTGPYGGPEVPNTRQIQKHHVGKGGTCCRQGSLLIGQRHCPSFQQEGSAASMCLSCSCCVAPMLSGKVPSR